MNKQTEALKLALECIEAWDRGGNASDYWRDRFDAITAIREALAEQPAQQQEPVAWISESENLLSWDKFYDHMTPLYTSPPASKPWVGLTGEEKKEIERLSIYVEGAIRHTEAKLREKNYG